MSHRFREPVSGLTHLAWAILSVVGLVWLVLLTHDDTAKMITMVIYGISTLLLFGASAFFHLSHGSEQRLLLLRRLDHAAIYLMIAGSYTPFLYNLLQGPPRWLMLLLVWSLAVVGIVYKLFFLRGSSHISTVFYLGMGWLALLAAPYWLPLLDGVALLLLLGGGMVYSVGALVYMAERPNLHRHFGHHELWHLFVMGGSVMHFLVIAYYIA